MKEEVPYMVTFQEEERDEEDLVLDLSGAEDQLRIRHIVAASDLSEGGRHAMVAGLDLARRAGARLSVLSVVEIPGSLDHTPVGDPAGGGWLELRQEEVRRAIDAELKEVGAENTLVHVGVGDPPAVVAAFAGKFLSSLVVVGAHRLSSFQRVLAGSTGERIAQHAGCPVMVAPQGRTGPLRKILAAVDLSPISSSILRHAAQLSVSDGAEVRVVFSEEPAEVWWQRLTPGRLKRRRRKDRDRFEGLVREAPLPERTEAMVLAGPAGRAILKEARRWSADLVVLGVRTHRFLTPERLGRTTRHVLRHGDRSIVVVPR